MKTKDEMKKLFEKIDETEESLLIIHIGKDDRIGGFVAGDDDMIAAAIATILNDGYGDKDEQGIQRLAKSIVKGVGAVISIPSISGIAIATEILDSVKTAAKNAKKGVFSLLAALKDKYSQDNDADDDDDDEEDCEHCAEVGDCPLPSAVKYRREHIARFRKQRNRGRNKPNKNEKCS